MKFEIEFTKRASDHIRALKKFEQQVILDSVEKHLQYEPTEETKKRKHLGERNFRLGTSYRKLQSVLRCNI